MGGALVMGWIGDVSALFVCRGVGQEFDIGHYIW